MDINAARPAWLKTFPALAALDEDPAWRRAYEASRVVTLPPGTATFRAGDTCRNYVMVLNGAIRVQKVSESGREIVLYRVEAGQTCVLTTSCMLGGERYPAEGVTEGEVQAVALPHAAFQSAMAESAGFRQFVFATLGDRLTEMMLLVEAIAFGQLDKRLATRLLALSRSGQVLNATHQQLAAELGSAREVVSRLLKDFERRGWLALQRGQIELRDPNALEALTRK